MKKSFPFHVPGQADARVLESIKNDVRKYVKRERRKPLKEGVDFWDFDCRVGASAETAATVHPEEVIKAIDTAAQAEGATSVLVEILAKPGVRVPKPKPVDPAALAAAGAAGVLAATAWGDEVGTAAPAESAPGETPASADGDGYIAPSEAFDADGPV